MANFFLSLTLSYLTVACALTFCYTLLLLFVPDAHFMFVVDKDELKQRFVAHKISQDEQRVTLQMADFVNNFMADRFRSTVVFCLFWIVILYILILQAIVKPQETK